MKNIFFFFIILVIVVSVSSCSLQKKAVLLPELEYVEAIMYAHPDSALKVLEQMRMPKSSDELNHATWCLFLAQAKYKSYIKQPSDSLINILLIMTLLMYANMHVLFSQICSIYRASAKIVQTKRVL
ncbi:hypothetical protein [Bacteroides sp. 51]|uniref:hypothetical protein n=1 Tax=Bacteroides sp. 51 TaxID=2302938 RepID=UPI0013D2FC75|nr:hypothetical protein [Bacteroides sp. 51]NDV83095.1 hypothetical protein [Bacteroides sp. 51]